jgi:uncharacterized phage-like protein YoqJ
MRIAITGHRPNKLGNDYALTSPLILAIRKRIIEVLEHHAKDLPDAEYEQLTLITGMALGVDTLFAEIAIQLQLPFIAAVPCFDQQKMWPKISQDRYQKIIMDEMCSEVVIVSPKAYDSTVMQIRNKWMVDNCDILIAVWDGTSGGTCNCVKYAKEVNKEIVYINPLNYAE